MAHFYFDSPIGPTPSSTIASVAINVTPVTDHENLPRPEDLLKDRTIQEISLPDMSNQHDNDTLFKSEARGQIGYTNSITVPVFAAPQAPSEFGTIPQGYIFQGYMGENILQLHEAPAKNIDCQPTSSHRRSKRLIMINGPAPRPVRLYQAIPRNGRKKLLLVSPKRDIQPVRAYEPTSPQQREKVLITSRLLTCPPSPPIASLEILGGRKRKRCADELDNEDDGTLTNLKRLRLDDEHGLSNKMDIDSDNTTTIAHRLAK